VDLKKLLRSSPFRLAVAYASLFAGSALLLLSFVYWSTAGYMLRQADETIEAEIAGLAERYRTGGLVGLTRLIERRLARQQPTGSSLYLVADAAYRPRVGNLSAWPQVEADNDGWLNFRLGQPEGEETHWARARQFRLDRGYFLLAGRDMYELESIRVTVVQTVAWGFALTMVLALVGGVLVSRGRIRRVSVINHAISDVVAGDLTRRIPTEATGDDIEQLTNNLNRMLAELEEQVDAVQRVSDNIAHDLRTPLARLRTRLELLRESEIEPGQSRYELAERAVGEADGLLATFNALLRIARIEAGKRRQEFSRVDITRLIHDVAELYGPLLDEAGVRLDTQPESGLTVIGDRDLLFQAVANLIDNVLKHVPSGGYVTVTSRCSPSGVDVVVADNGPGVPADERIRVLERFYRLDASRTKPGAGLGLSLVNAVAKLHDATLSLSENHPGLQVALCFGRESAVDKEV
jgi:signal transduction histidine kinase